jgi:hypothetical protein
MSLHWGVDFLLQCLPTELKVRLKEITVDPFYNGSDEGYPFCNGRAGEVLRVVPSSASLRVSRKKIRVLLSEGIDFRVSDRSVSILPC